MVRLLTRPQVSRVLRELPSHRTSTHAEMLAWLIETQGRNARAKQSHLKRCLRRQSVFSVTHNLGPTNSYECFYATATDAFKVYDTRANSGHC